MVKNIFRQTQTLEWVNKNTSGVCAIPFLKKKTSKTFDILKIASKETCLRHPFLREGE